MSASVSVRPRWGRIGAASSSLVVTVVALLGGIGVLPSSADEPAAGHRTDMAVTASYAAAPVLRWPAGRPDRTGIADDPTDSLPADSGEGRRVVFSESDQRVWLVDDSGEVTGSWLVSGSLTDNLQPGSYQVWSRSRHAWGIDGSGTMQYFVRFAEGERAAIGFHDIPVDDGRRVQRLDQLGTPQSHGCIRQRRADARRMWAFARMGTPVVVTA